MEVAAAIVNAVRLIEWGRLHAHDRDHILLMGGRFLSLERTG
jgi:hypothetical protein